MSYKSLTRTLPLAIVLFLLVSYNFISAQWTNAPASPPLSNPASPINVSATNQVKLGGLGTGALSVVGDIGVTDGSPSVLLSDTNGIDMWLYNNASWFYLLADRTNDGAWDSPHPMQVFVSATSSNLDWARFSNQIRANQYCDFAGNNCFNPAAISPAAGERILKTNSLSNNTLLSGSAVRALWNTHVENTWANGPASLRTSSWRDSCLWEGSEGNPAQSSAHPTGMPSVAERLEWCGSIMCRHHSALNPTPSHAVVMSNTGVCGAPGVASCPTGFFYINCIF